MIRSRQGADFWYITRYGRTIIQIKDARTIIFLKQN